LIAEISIAGIPAIESKQGLGTHVAKELVYAYAMWISAAFHLKVIRAYDAMVMAPQPVLNLREPLQMAAAQRAPYPMLVELYGEEGQSNFGQSYINSQNKEMPEYLLPKREIPEQHRNRRNEYIRENADAILNAIVGVPPNGGINTFKGFSWVRDDRGYIESFSLIRWGG
jgi:hypothetical protein